MHTGRVVNLDENPFEQKDDGYPILSRLLWGALTLIVLAADAAQIGLIALLNEYRTMAGGESKGYAGMGLVKVTVYALPLIVPGALLALGFLGRAIIRRRRFGASRGGNASFIFFAGSTLITLVFVGMMVAAD